MHQKFAKPNNNGLKWSCTMTSNEAPDIRESQVLDSCQCSPPAFYPYDIDWSNTPLRLLVSDRIVSAILIVFT